MRIIITGIAVSSLLLASLSFSQAQSLWDVNEPVPSSLKEANMKEFTASSYKPGIIRHIVLLHYKPGVSEAKRTAISERVKNLKYTALRNGRPYIISIKSGKQNSFEFLERKFDQVFILKFASEGDRNYFVGYPDIKDPTLSDASQKKLREVITPLLAESGVIVFDFTSNK